MTEQPNNKKSLLNSYLLVNQVLEMDPKGTYYREFKNRLTAEELEVVRYLQHHRALEKLKMKKENKLPVDSTKGRKKKPVQNAIQVYDNTDPSEAPPTEELPPAYPS